MKTLFSFFFLLLLVSSVFAQSSMKYEVVDSSQKVIISQGNLVPSLFRSLYPLPPGLFRSTKSSGTKWLFLNCKMGGDRF